LALPSSMVRNET